MQQSQVDYWTFRVFNEEDDLLDTVHDFSSAMYDNFHHLAPEIIDAFGSLCENEDIGFTLYSALCESKNAATFISSEPHPVKSVEWTIDSIKIRDTRVPDTTTIQRIDFILGLMRMVLSRSPYVHVKPSTKRLINGRVYTDKCFQIHL
jgi:hypothetical protein